MSDYDDVLAGAIARLEAEPDLFLVVTGDVGEDGSVEPRTTIGTAPDVDADAMQSMGASVIDTAAEVWDVSRSEAARMLVSVYGSV